MTVVAITQIEGDKRELLSKYDEVVGKVLADPPGGILSHTCLVLESGIRIATVWENEEAARAFYTGAAFQDALKGAAMPSTGPNAYYPVHNFRLFR